MRHGQKTSIEIIGWCYCALPLIGLAMLADIVSQEYGFFAALGLYIAAAILSSIVVYILTLRKKDNDK